MTLNHVDRRKDIVIQRTGSTERREKIVLDRVAARRAILYKAVQLVWMLGGILEALLGLRVLLKFVAADPNAAFAQFIYQASGLFVAPFNNLTVNPAVNGMVLELTTMIAMITYGLVTWIVVQAIWILFYRVYVRSLTTYRRLN